ncbi:MAG: LVIVD repeat-containing protein [Actinomycetota bacterium]
MRKIVALACSALVLLGGLSSAGAGPTLGGFASDNIEYVRHVPFDIGTATGARLIGKYLYVTSWRNFSIYDVSDPLNPTLSSTTPFGFAFENEDVATDGNILLFSESLPRNILHIWNVEDKSNPVKISELAGAGDHTMSCILKCRYAYGSDGTIVDLRDPTDPKFIAKRTDPNSWHKQTQLQGDAHDIEEFKNGFAITSPISDGLQLLDVRDPAHPKVLARGIHPAPGQWLFHSGKWPRSGEDDFIVMEGEGTDGPILTYNARAWQKDHTFELIDQYTVEAGMYVDGRSRDNGESSHWFDTHPKWNDGGLIAAGWYSHGMRLLRVASNGKIKEVGYFLPYGGSTFSAYWVGPEIIYNVDLNRGIEILRYTGK